MKTKILNLFFTGMVICGAVISGCSKNESINELKDNPQLLSARSGETNQISSDISLLNHDLGYTLRQ